LAPVHGGCRTGRSLNGVEVLTKRLASTVNAPCRKRLIYAGGEEEEAKAADAPSHSPSVYFRHVGLLIDWLSPRVI
jgi:hypothetical protein